jgi:hypothetical protein
MLEEIEDEDVGWIYWIQDTGYRIQTSDGLF